MKIKYLTKESKLWEMDFSQGKKPFREYRESKELAAFQHVDQASDRVRRLYDIFNEGDVRQIDFTGITTLIRMVTRNLGMLVDDVGASDEIYERFCTSVQRSWKLFCNGSLESGVVVMQRDADGELVDADEPDGGFNLGNLSGHETLLIPSDVVCNRHACKLRLRIDLKPESAVSRLGAEHVLLTNHVGESLCGLCDCNGAIYEGLDDFPQALAKALGETCPDDGINAELFKAMCLFAPSADSTLEMELGENASGSTVSLIIERSDTDRQAFELKFEINGRELRVSDLVQKRKHQLEVAAVYKECEWLGKAVSAYFVTPKDVGRLVKLAEPYLQEGVRADVSLLEATRFAFSNGRVEPYAAFDRIARKEFVGGLVPIRLEAPGARIRYERTPTVYLNICRSKDGNLEFVSLESPAEAARRVRSFNRLVRDLEIAA